MAHALQRGVEGSAEAGEGGQGELVVVDGRHKVVAAANHAVQGLVKVPDDAAHGVGGHVLEAEHDAAPEHAPVCRRRHRGHAGGRAGGAGGSSPGPGGAADVRDPLSALVDALQRLLQLPASGE